MVRSGDAAIVGPVAELLLDVGAGTIGGSVFQPSGDVLSLAIDCIVPSGISLDGKHGMVQALGNSTPPTYLVQIDNSLGNAWFLEEQLTAE
jgi:hypothetical protein